MDINNTFLDSDFQDMVYINVKSFFFFNETKPSMLESHTRPCMAKTSSNSLVHQFK